EREHRFPAQHDRLPHPAHPARACPAPRRSGGRPVRCLLPRPLCVAGCSALGGGRGRARAGDRAGRRLPVDARPAGRSRPRPARRRGRDPRDERPGERGPARGAAAGPAARRL
ncbi:MAG: hypothetical protein AVDCRST_MAG24-218, partial [uncultured Nocardioidaceae bacterium]